MNINNLPPVVTIDGPTGSGKGTIGQLLAEKIHWHFLDSGAIYRVLALEALEEKILPDDAAKLESLASSLDIEFIYKVGHPEVVLSKGYDVSQAIRQEGCGVYASQIAALPNVRAALLDCQRRFRTAPGLVADGRDMGTIVFPDAVLKVFLTASVSARAQRRYEQLQGKGINVSLREVEVDLVERDLRDQKRLVAPLKPSPDAYILDTTNLSVDAILQNLLERLKSLHVIE